MRRPLNWFVVLLSLGFLLAGHVLSSRGGGGSSGAATLPAAERAAVLDAALRSAMRDKRPVGVAVGPVALPSIELSDVRAAR